MRPLTFVLIGIVALTTGCDPTYRSCELTDLVSDNGHGLSYDVRIPSSCPVPLGSIGEQKTFAATMVDGSPHDYNIALIVVKNSNGSEIGSDEVVFLPTINGAYRATPTTNFAASTGYTGSITNNQVLPDDKRDYGIITGFLTNNQVGVNGRLYMNYIGTNVQGTIAGPDVPLSNSGATWYGSASGGTGPYAYAWYQNGDLVGTSSSYATTVGSSPFGLRLVVTDQTQASRWTDLLVDVDGVRADISGSSTIYYSNGNATWTASLRGGYAPYTVNWYFDQNGQQTYAGSGTSLSSYPPAAGTYSLFATISDSNGMTGTSSTFSGFAIGDGNGGCVPEPPAIICSPQHP